MTNNSSQTSVEYLAPCGISLGELNQTSTQNLLNLLFEKCAICASNKRLILEAVFSHGRGEFLVECKGEPSFPSVISEV